MYVVFIPEDLTTIVAHISAENIAAAETLGNELIDQVEKLPTLAVSAVERMLPDSGVILEAAIRYIQHSSAA